ncbi:N-acetylglucosaminyl-diphospho-decaprenol L-rhamnosyltransferase [Rhodococcus sp. PvR044]|uniref:glycosyltransferase family 2 protein n=1 Tax=Rhodococcus TaxID=1827 RepID=UPI000BD1695D|nr:MULTISPECIES: glycosyltransferase family 2 protein [Rhodococcus]MBP1163024.1 N-acetylglucosaminyl-diphospho-decaprenol L-rhamnosyltransferase [Rhodococcus sp. PvR099]MCZ4554641.1 glycosyltransferase family 2 protein [Rhodococcus maanshanensis]PTR44386.1 N-acetylglucosaminyl-diphospho-decaprenol L-rhamnosyltransferase [Rhodococcus sp. OK611]SNX89827.1 N-acetylglucosaminyl-diphospho-decaprenol L-rhamnosyltransferase [Rhodococcus sp. OK270]
MSSQLAVVTVTYSPGKHLQSFLDTLEEATTLETQVVMADNGSTDGAPEAALEQNSNVRLLRTGGNIGYGGAINRAVAELDPDVEFVVIANPDLRWGAGSLDVLLDAAQRWPRAGALGPMVLEPDGSVYPSARQVPGLVSGAGHALLGTVWPSNPWTQRYRQENEQVSERPVGWLSGSCLLVRRAAFDSINGFDSRYFMYMEDVDFGDRLGRAGWHNVFVPSAEVTHAKGHAAGRHPELMLPAHHQSAYRFQADRHPHWWQAPLRWALRGGLAVRSKVAVAAAVRNRAKNEGTADDGE